MNAPLPALSELIERARQVLMTDAQIAAQRRSFAYGNTSIGNPLITRELVDRADAELFAINVRRSALDDDCRRSLPFKLTPHQKRLLWLIARRTLARPYVSVDDAFNALYGLRHESDQPDIKVIHVVMAQLRRRLPSSLKILTEPGIGYYMTPEHRAHLLLLAGVSDDAK